VLQNLVPGAVERLGLDAATLRARRPELIHCSISGYGSSGRYRSKKAYDLLVQCEAGLVSVTGTPQDYAKVGVSVADVATGMYAYSGILTALYERTRTGSGSTLEVAMLDALGEWMMQPTYYTVYGGQPWQRTGARHATIAPYGPYRAGDGSDVFLGVQSDREWAVVCHELLGRPDLVDDERYARNTERVLHTAEIDELIEAAIATSTADEVVERLDLLGIACARLRTPEEFFAHPQLAARDRWRSVDTVGGPVQALLPAVTVDGREAVMGAVPELGAHNNDLRAEFAPGRATARGVDA
jgi:itaconate CoA-transferase